MNQALSTFMKIGVTVVVIAALLFGIGYGMVKTQADEYIQQDISHSQHPLSTSGPTTNE